MVGIGKVVIGLPGYLEGKMKDFNFLDKKGRFFIFLTKKEDFHFLDKKKDFHRHQEI